MSVPLHLGRRILGPTFRRLSGGKTAPSGTNLVPHSPAAVSSSESIDQNGFIFVDLRRPFSATPRNYAAPNDLMDHPRVVPDILDGALRFFRDKFFERYIIHRYDADFSMEEFKKGAKFALLVVSDILASDDVTPLLTQGLVESTAFAEIEVNHKSMDSARRRRLRVEEKAILHVHLHRIGIIEDDVTGHKAVEIMMFFAVGDPDVLRNLRPTAKESRAKQIMNNVMLCNYRFHRDFSNDKGWVLNVVNQFFRDSLFV